MDGHRVRPATVSSRASWRTTRARCARAKWRLKPGVRNMSFADDFPFCSFQKIRDFGVLRATFHIFSHRPRGVVPARRWRQDLGPGTDGTWGRRSGRPYGENCTFFTPTARPKRRAKGASQARQKEDGSSDDRVSHVIRIVSLVGGNLGPTFPRVLLWSHNSSPGTGCR